MSDYILRIVRYKTPFEEGDANEVYLQEFQTGQIDPETGERQPDLCVSVYKTEDVDKSTIAGILMKHSANAPLGSPFANDTILRVGEFIKGRSVVQSDITGCPFGSLSAAHHEIRMVDKNDLDSFIKEIVDNYSNIKLSIELDDINRYIESVVTNKDEDWIKVVRSGPRPGKKLNSAWLNCNSGGNSMKSFFDDTYCGDLAKIFPILTKKPAVLASKKA